MKYKFYSVMDYDDVHYLAVASDHYMFRLGTINGTWIRQEGDPSHWTNPAYSFNPQRITKREACDYGKKPLPTN